MWSLEIHARKPPYKEQIGMNRTVMKNFFTLKYLLHKYFHNLNIKEHKHEGLEH